MRPLRVAAAAVLVLGLSACSPGSTADNSSPAPSGQPGADTGTPTEGALPSGPTAAADLPAPQGVLPAPEQREPQPAASAAPVPEPEPEPASEPASEPAEGAYTDAGAIDVVVNKRRPLQPLDFTPADLRQPNVATATDNGLLRPDTAAAVEEMFAAAAADGVGLTLVSGYRSYATQESTYAYWVGQYGGTAGADTVSARPGFSEHQTGLAFDIGQTDGACTLVSCFAGTAAAQWAAANAADYGIIVRYPLGADGTTGFSAEPWHLRFVGRDVALAMEAAGTPTLEEHFGLPAAPSY